MTPPLIEVEPEEKVLTLSSRDFEAGVAYLDHPIEMSEVKVGELVVPDMHAMVYIGVGRNSGVSLANFTFAEMDLSDPIPLERLITVSIEPGVYMVPRMLSILVNRMTSASHNQYPRPFQAVGKNYTYSLSLNDGVATISARDSSGRPAQFQMTTAGFYLENSPWVLYLGVRTDQMNVLRSEHTFAYSDIYRPSVEFVLKSDLPVFMASVGKRPQPILAAFTTSNAHASNGQHVVRPLNGWLKLGRRGVISTLSLEFEVDRYSTKPENLGGFYITIVYR